MALEDWWSPATLAYFVERYGGSREAAVVAWNQDGYREQLERHGVRREIAPDGEPYLSLSAPDRERAVAQYIEAAVGPSSRYAQSQGGAPPAGSTGSKGKNYAGKLYAGKLVEDVVRLASAAVAQHGKQLGRTLRNELYRALAKNDYGHKQRATTYAIDEIFELMKEGTLEDAGRAGWLKVAGRESATAAFINLHALRKPARKAEESSAA